jgi:hypothetical protein
MDLTNYLRKDYATPSIYYGYSLSSNANSTDFSWSIRREETGVLGIGSPSITSSDIITWTNGSNVQYISNWDNRVKCFQAPSTSLNATYSVLSTPDSFSLSRKTLSLSWDLIEGVDIYQVTIKESGKIYNNDGHQIYNTGFNSGVTKELINRNSYNYLHGQSGLTYSVTISGSNLVGSTSSNFNMTT